MSTLKTGRNLPRGKRRTWALLCSVAFVFLFTQLGQGATVTNPFTFSSNEFLTGDYVVFGGPMNGPTENGFTKTTITIPSGTIPANATAVGAYLYWGSVVHQSDPTAGTEAFFKAGGSTEKAIQSLTRIVNPGGTSPCSSGGGATGNGSLAQQFVLHNADVLRYLELDPLTGKFKLNNTYEVRLRDTNDVDPLGASLLLVFRNVDDPSSQRSWSTRGASSSTRVAT